MRSSRIILNRPAYHHVIFELWREAEPLSLPETREFERLLIAASRFHDVPLAAYSVSPIGAHLLLLDRQTSPVPFEEALELDIAMSSGSLAAYWKSILDSGRKLSPLTRKKAEQILKRRGGLESFARSIKGRFAFRIGRNASERLWADRYRSYPVQKDPEVLAGLITFIHFYDAVGRRISTQRYPSSWNAVEAGDKTCRAAMVEALECRDWRAARALLASVKPSDPKLWRCRNKKGGVLPNYGEIPQRELASALRRSAKRKPVLAEVDARFEKMFAQWKVQVSGKRKRGGGIDGELREWANAIRAAKRRGKLRPEWEARLSAANFLWSVRRKTGDKGGPITYPGTFAAATWQKQFAAMQEYRQIHGRHSLPPSMSTLGRWLWKQRLKKEKGLLQDWQMEELNKLGIDLSSPKKAVKPRTAA